MLLLTALLQAAQVASDGSQWTLVAFAGGTLLLIVMLLFLIVTTGREEREKGEEHGERLRPRDSGGHTAD